MPVKPDYPEKSDDPEKSKTSQTISTPGGQRSMPHPFEKEVIAEADRLETQIGILIDKRSSNIEKGIDDIDTYIHDKETKLRAIRQHQKREFKELLHALDREVYCPFCFIYHNHLFKLIPHRKYKNHDLIECTICNATLQKPASMV